MKFTVRTAFRYAAGLAVVPVVLALTGPSTAASAAAAAAIGPRVQVGSGWGRTGRSGSPTGIVTVTRTSSPAMPPVPYGSTLGRPTRPDASDRQRLRSSGDGT